MRILKHAVFLALSDYWQEKLLSACSILGLAAILAPLLILFGVRHGVISTMQERLMQDPRNLELIPEGSRKYDEKWFAMLRKDNRTGFLLPQTRTIAATMQLVAGEGMDTVRTNVNLIATAAGDPLLAHWNNDPATWLHDEAPFPIAISATSAQKLKISQGALITGEIDRRRNEKNERQKLALTVAHVLPLEVQQKEAVYLSLDLLVALEDFRDGKAVPSLGWEGDEPAEDAPEISLVAREYPTFRLYAKELDDVEPLRRFLLQQRVDSKTQADSIERVKSLNVAFTAVFALICGASLVGFAASTASNALASVRRKSRSLGILRLMGFPRNAMMLFPVAQAVTTGFLGCVIATVLYLVVAYSIDALFAGSLPDNGALCFLLPQHFIATYCIVITLSVLSSLAAAWKVSTIEPSEVIRDV